MASSLRGTPRLEDRKLINLLNEYGTGRKTPGKFCFVIRGHDSFACIDLQYFIPKPKVNACVQKFEINK